MPSLNELKLTVLHEISGIIGQILSLEPTLESILSILSERLSMQRGTVTLTDPGTNMLKICASHGLSQEEKQKGIYAPNEGVTGRIFQTATPFIVPDVGKEPLFLNKTGSRDLHKGAIAFLGVPIQLQSKPIGVFSVDRLFGPEVAYEEDIRFLTIVGALIAQFVMLNEEVARREETLVTENRSLRAEVSRNYNHFFTVGVSPAMQALNKMIKKVAPSRASVLLLGESGTGKTLSARIIHELSQRARGPFIKVNCAALPDNLIESELFGYERGAFTGADGSKKGRLEEAHTGTVFLDEIGELPIAVQSKLLRFIQEREFERLGDSRTRQVDVRLIAATNMDLATAVSDGRFREDLYYRLNVFPIAIPPLRDREVDIPLLVDYFLDKLTDEYGQRFHFAPDAMAALRSYQWPGNVRELENLMERLCILAEEPLLRLADLPRHLSASDVECHPKGTSLEDMERRSILNALGRNNWLQYKAADELGLTLRQIGYRIKKYGLDADIRAARGR